MKKILIVDDEAQIRQLISRYAEHEGYQVTTAENGKMALGLCRSQSFDAVILDIMMPEMDGFTALKEIRKLQDIPVIMLSALGSEYDKLMGFELGVEDYVVKPFSPRELMARLKVVLQRNHRETDLAEDAWLLAGTIRVNTLARTAWVNGKDAELTAKEYDLLVYFLQNKGIALSRNQILNAVWGYDYFGDERTVDWQVKLLRKKLGQERTKIRTLRGMGYRFEEN